jgi:hypothetical protein
MDRVARRLRADDRNRSIPEVEGIRTWFEPVGSRGLLMIAYDSGTSLGLVRLRAKKAAEELEPLLRRWMALSVLPPGRGGGTGGTPVPAELRIFLTKRRS